MKKVLFLLVVLMVGMSTAFAQKVKEPKVKAELYLPDNVLVADVFDFIGYDDVTFTDVTGAEISEGAGYIITLTFIVKSEEPEKELLYRNLFKENTACSVKLRWDDVCFGSSGDCVITRVTEENLIFNVVLLGNKIVKKAKF